MLVSASLGNSAAQAARIMLALREREQTAAEVAAAAALAPDEAKALLDAPAAIEGAIPAVYSLEFSPP